MNELYRAYRNSCEMQTNNWVDVPAGLFAVVAECPAHCPVTDATLPNPARSIVGLYGTRRIAEYHARRLNTEAHEAEDYDVGYAVWPRLTHWASVPGTAPAVLSNENVRAIMDDGFDDMPF